MTDFRPHLVYVYTDAYGQCFGQAMRLRRESKGYTQADLAAQGRSVAFDWLVDDIERGRIAAHIFQMRDVARALGVRLSQLLLEAEELYEERYKKSEGIEALPEKESK